MPKPKKEKIPPISSIEEFTAVVDEIALSTQEFDAIALRQERAIARIRARFAAKLQPIKERVDRQFKRATKFAVLKRAELLPKEAKSSCTALAEFGFRTGNPTLSLAPGFTWEDVQQSIQMKAVEFGILAMDALEAGQDDKAAELNKEREKWQSLLVTKTEVAKDNVKSLLTDEERAMIGTEVTQGESFWVAAKKEKEAKPAEAQEAA